MLLPQQLYNHIPRKVSQWSSRDVEKWFTLNNIQTSETYQSFKQTINGIAFITASPQLLLDTCLIPSRMIIKRIIQWLEYDREQFEDYVEEHSIHRNCQQQAQSQISPCLKDGHIQTQLQQINQRFISENLPTQKNKQNTPMLNHEEQQQRHFQGIKPIFEVQKWKKKKIVTQESISIERKQSQKQERNGLSKQNSNRLSKDNNKSQNYIPLGANFVKSAYQMLESIIQLRFEQKSQFLNNSGKIGRNNGNDIIILGDSVSRRHAQIIKDKNQFYLKDSDSRFGTFIQIGLKNRRNIEEGDIIAFQDSQLQILKFKFNKSNNTFDLKVRKLAQEEEILHFYGRKIVRVGRDCKDISFSDSRIHGSHCRITLQAIGQLVIIEQQGKCFKKLRKELHKIDEKDTIIRLGLAIVQIKMMNNHQPIENISQFDSNKH